MGRGHELPNVPRRLDSQSHLKSLYLEIFATLSGRFYPVACLLDRPTRMTWLLRNVQGICSMGDDATHRSLGKSLLGSFQHPVPVPWSKIVGPHVSELDCSYPSYLSKFGYGIQ